MDSQVMSTTFVLNFSHMFVEFTFEDIQPL